ncbi:MAG TPA: PHP-associated domain-containing protein [Candidatus Saccharimonadales bacterium]|nr:PHP-associated domain-containing protein [Candidatus Saccharimonadales bacterium]HSW96420.1 PHP-associated domain-containing protein [Candidatus Saccharimonadales bacterium]
MQKNDKMYKVDLHTHSIISHDGGISRSQYKQILKDKVVDFIAVTDHNDTRFAKELNAELGPQIIVGEEITTLDGEIIGLFLNKTIPSSLSAIETVRKIKNDNGLVYIPHPFETNRYGLQEDVLKAIIRNIDILEVFNGRGIIRGRGEKAQDLAENYKIAMSASSDAHCRLGMGSTFTIINKVPTQKTLVMQLEKGILEKKYPALISLLCPSINKIKNKFLLGV